MAAKIEMLCKNCEHYDKHPLNGYYGRCVLVNDWTVADSDGCDDDCFEAKYVEEE